MRRYYVYGWLAVIGFVLILAALNGIIEGGHP